MAVFSAITAVLTSIGVAIAGAAGATLGTAAFSAIVGSTLIGGWAAIATGLVFGGMALSKSASGSFDYQSPVSSSPTYGSGVIQTQTNNNLPIPLIYGNVKCAGNRIWQNDSGESTIKRLVSFGWGQIGGFSAVKLNDNDHNESGINATITEYTGTSSQTISTLIPGATNAERAEVVGGLKNIAYLAIEVSKSDKVNENYNLTAVVQGLKVNQYTDEDTYTNAFSNNTAWCLLDLLTNYNGLRLGRDSDNTFDNDLLKEIVDIQSFIDAADYCDDAIGYYAKTTSLTGDNNDLIWQGRASGDNGITITYVDPAGASQEASIELDGTDITVNLATDGDSLIITTANDIIDLVNNDSDIAALVRVMSADGNDGTGVVTALTEQALTLDEAVTRYAFNMIFDSKFSIRDAVEEFKLNCNGAFTVKDGKLQFKIDKPETSKQTFTTKDIKKGTLKEWFEPRGDRYDVLKVEYIDPEYDYSKVEAHIERTTPFNTPIIDHKIQCYSVNSFFHASRLGKLYMLRSELCSRFISFTTGYQAVGRQIGDVITLTYEKGNTTIFDAKLFKIYMMVDNQKGELEIYCREYDERIYSDELGSLEPVVNTIVINPQEKLRAATFVIASPDSLNKEQADYICDNAIGADVAIQSVIDNLPLQVLETGTAQTGSTASSIKLDGVSQRTIYNSLYIRFTSGNCATEGYKIIDGYTPSTDTVTVASAFTETPANGDTYEILQVAGEILLLEGNYELLDFVKLRPGTIISGMGNGTVISYLTTSGFIYEDETAGIINVKLYDLKVGPTIVISPSQINPPIITCGEFAYNLQFDNISGIETEIAKVNSTGTASNIQLKNSRIESNEYTFIKLYDGTEIINNYITGKASTNFYTPVFGTSFDTMENITFKNNVFKDITGYCTNIECNNSVLSGNVFQNIGSAEIFSVCLYGGGSNNHISDNSALECYANLMYFGSYEPITNCQITNNSAINCGLGDSEGYIYAFSQASYNNIQGNVARAKAGDATGYAIYLRGNNNIISNNDFKGATAYAVATTDISGTGNTTNNNRT